MHHQSIASFRINDVHASPQFAVAGGRIRHIKIFWAQILRRKRAQFKIDIKAKRLNADTHDGMEVENLS